MATQRFSVTAGAGAFTIPYQITQQMQVIVGPSVLSAGAVLLEFSQSPNGPWLPWSYPVTLNGCGSFRPPTTCYVRVTATTQNANVFVCDYGGSNQPLIDQVLNVTAPIGSPSTTAEVALLSWRTPPNFLPAAFRMRVLFNLLLTNGAAAKTPRIRVGGLAGSVVYLGLSLASILNYNGAAEIVGRGDGSSLQGYNAGAAVGAGGWGSSTVAYSTATTDYLNQELEWVLTITKGTAGDTVQLESALVMLY